MTRWYENIVEGEEFPLGAHTFTQAEIIRFGKAYDPQYFHIDAKAAKKSHFGGLVASGWHTVSVGHRMMVDALAADDERQRAAGEEPGVAGPSPGVNSMDFRAPVRPGDKITFLLVVVSKRVSESVPGWGVLINRLTGTNQKGELVYQAELASFTKLRDFEPETTDKLVIWANKFPILRRLLGK